MDEHFGDWAVLPLQKHPGVIRIKSNPATTKTILTVLLPFLKEHGYDDFSDTLTIVSEKGIRRIKTGML